MGEPHARFMVRSWSPDGRELAGESRGDDGSPTGIIIYSFESGKFERVTDFGWYPQWLSDGHRLLFHSQGTIYLVDRRSRKVHEVLSIAPQEVAPYRFALSRDGRWIYFGVTATEADIWLMSLD